MRLHNFAIIALVAMTAPAAAQTSGGTSGPAGSSLGATPPPGSVVGRPPTDMSNPAPVTNPSTGTGTTGSSTTLPSTTAPPVAGVPNTSTPGTIGTGASPSGLPGDDPARPGFPAGTQRR